MKFFAIALLGVFYLALTAGYPVDDDVRGVGVPRQYRVAVENYLNTTLNSEVDTTNVKNLKFYLYTVQQPERVRLYVDSFLQNWVMNSTYDSSRPTKVFIHDRLFSEYHYKELVTAYLVHYHTPVNVITVDYSYYTGAEHKEFMKVYQEIGATVAKFFENLRNQGVAGNNIHVIGHGIGAHIAAVAAREVAPFKFGRITGLDPVGLEFDENNNLPQLQKSDADVVDVIVTNMAGVGSKQTERGHVNFYPNGGDSQPKSDMLTSHLKSYFYYVESISRGKVFPSYAAESYVEWKNKPNSYNKVNYMGEYIVKNLAGNFYLDVNPIPPYGVATDPTFKSYRAKFEQTYLSLILGSELAPWAFTPKNDPHFRKAVANQNTFYIGLGERLNNNNYSKEYHENTLRYSNNPRV